MHFTRRTLLGAAAASLIGCGRDRGLFPFGVACGDVTTTRAILWTRFTGAGPLRLRVSSQQSKVLDTEVTVGSDGFTHVDVADLEPGRRYRYYFTAGGSRSDAGTFRTLIAEEDMAPLVFGVSSCSHQSYQPFPVLKHAARHGLDLFFHLGDHVYNDGVTTLEGLRDEYALNWSSSGMRALRRSCAWYDTWDD